VRQELATTEIHPSEIAEIQADESVPVLARAQLGITCQRPLHRALERDEALVYAAELGFSAATG